jgi:hypothetical protein
VYQFSLNGGSLQLNNTFPNMNTGNYTVMVTDGNNCTATTVISITQPLPLALSLSSSSILCNGGTGTLTCNPTGGTSPYQYSLNGGAFQSGNLFTNLLPGTYTVQVKDAHNCTTTSSFTITQPQSLNVNSSYTAISCNGGSSIVTVTATGGVIAYSYSLNGSAFQSSNAFTVSAGGYTITVKDGNNCTASTTGIILQPPPLGLTLSTPGILCNGGNALLTANTSGGVAPYQFSLNGGVSQLSNSFPSLSIGSYTVVVTDANGCSKSSTM